MTLDLDTWRLIARDGDSCEQCGGQAGRILARACATIEAQAAEIARLRAALGSILAEAEASIASYDEAEDDCERGIIHGWISASLIAKAALGPQP